uniref:NADH-ubiquinone oxidoreductase chain 2 n=1 Tax=Megatherium americanum TaxID=2546660 RepID=A0A4Y5T1Y3_MEGAE|nr:NADH dehydrogenase subunit 2 [Megatherium americanum]QDA81129.1 NADH dehydrogenase subunit 2 [Megatherium americanum]QDA81142.1 NADH dehydrogenase subunit 2 [Megatherium americanum]QDA81155.1 NADH dehydrogenase subunit 2 [Megatherium americanum]
MNPMTLSIIMSTLFSGTMITMFSSHWLLIWTGLEINMFTMIPILMLKRNPRSTEAATKYFLMQATASMLLMMGVMINLMYSGQWTIMKIFNQPASYIITISIAMKLGLAPFHFWVPEVSQGTSLLSGTILLTWQKLAPISILHQITTSIDTTLLLTMAVLSIAIGGWGGLNQTQLRKIMAYSSIAHMGWMMAIIIYNPTLMILNLTIYLLMTTSMFLLFIQQLSTTTLALTHTWNTMPFLTILTTTTLLSMGGLPPLSGFLPKWMIIQEMTKNDLITLPTAMAVMALLNLYFYMRLVYSTSLTLFPSINNTKTKWQFKPTTPPPLMPTLIILSTMAIPLSPMLYILE